MVNYGSLEVIRQGIGSDHERCVVTKADPLIAIDPHVFQMAIDDLPDIKGGLVRHGDDVFSVGAPGAGLGRVFYRITGRDGEHYVARLLRHDELCSCGLPLLNDGVCPAYPDYANGEHPKTVRLPAIWTCPPDLNPDHVNAPESERKP